MFIAAIRQRKESRGFTLLEITLAVAILAMVAMAIYRFVATNLAAVRISAQENAIDAHYTGFINLVASQMQELSTAGGVMGDPYKFNDQSQDEVRWICSSGPGLLTRYAPGEYLVSLRLQRAEGKANRMDIGFLRKPRDTPEGSTEGESWVPVLEDVRSLEVRYYDPRLPAWVDKWTDTNVMPRLVKLLIGRPDRQQPMETIIALARTPLQIAPQMPQMPQVPTANQNPANLTPGNISPGSNPNPGKDGNPNPGLLPPKK
jgi:prepilin-type N-terminal cleavage/methylation domain-containing protein